MARNAVVAETLERARWICTAFGLDRADWDCLTTEAEHAQRYDKIVMVVSLAKAWSVTPRVRTWLSIGHEDGLIVL